jgi:hypothetical protein
MERKKKQVQLEGRMFEQAEFATNRMRSDQKVLYSVRINNCQPINISPINKTQKMQTQNQV